MNKHKELITAGFNALAEGDSGPLMGLFDDSVQWRIIGDTKFSGLYKGMEEVTERLLGPLSELLDGHLHIFVDKLISEGDYLVCQGSGESKTVSGGTYNNTYCWVYKWSGDKITAVTEYLDTEILRASFEN